MMYFVIFIAGVAVFLGLYFIEKSWRSGRLFYPNKQLRYLYFNHLIPLIKPYKGVSFYKYLLLDLQNYLKYIQCQPDRLNSFIAAVRGRETEWCLVKLCDVLKDVCTHFLGDNEISVQKGFVSFCESEIDRKNINPEVFEKWLSK